MLFKKNWYAAYYFRPQFQIESSNLKKKCCFFPDSKYTYAPNLLNVNFMNEFGVSAAKQARLNNNNNHTARFWVNMCYQTWMKPDSVFFFLMSNTRSTIYDEMRARAVYGRMPCRWNLINANILLCARCHLGVDYGAAGRERARISIFKWINFNHSLTILHL